MGHARNERYARIRARAAEIWLQEGCPGDQQEHHWLLALREIDREDAARKDAVHKDTVLNRKPGRGAIPVRLARLAEPVIRLPAPPKARAAPVQRLRSSRI
ncbi:MAG TPA: DUF2934 domain-containing protein [Mesorhizobium sp.]|uniref:DUF2934 domain-containing protein n=1 Tax=Mesorhizobium sp. TaxID=1871066 RepID=UPI002DDD3602|nr:DUF2934 domain-containing protein [Mesorhizobium sp.]HEV2505400.1 DUF2934 domain-containing protein [Mesorhizobium sp.]